MRRHGSPLFWFAASMLIHGFLLLGGKSEPVSPEEPARNTVEIGLIRLNPQKAAPPPLPTSQPSPPPAAEKTPPENHSDSSADPEFDPHILPRAAPQSPRIEAAPAERPDPPEPATKEPQASEAPPPSAPRPVTIQAKKEALAPATEPPDTLRPSAKQAALPDNGRSERHAPLVKAAPRYQRNAPPAYPRVAQLRGWEGEVLLRATVGTDGLPRSVDLHRSSGHAALDQAALRAVRRWRFEPARRGEAPVVDTVLIPLEFKLEQ